MRIVIHMTHLEVSLNFLIFILSRRYNFLWLNDTIYFVRLREVEIRWQENYIYVQLPLGI